MKAEIIILPPLAHPVQLEEVHPMIGVVALQHNGHHIESALVLEPLCPSHRSHGGILYHIGRYIGHGDGHRIDLRSYYFRHICRHTCPHDSVASLLLCLSSVHSDRMMILYHHHDDPVSFENLYYHMKLAWSLPTLAQEASRPLPELHSLPLQPVVYSDPSEALQFYAFHPFHHQVFLASNLEQYDPSQHQPGTVCPQSVYHQPLCMPPSYPPSPQTQ
mmetsp:Transcript_7968/g.15988  ORF Transcript_7968/g.15988 Transcript_7968/m.15988 type:complete len:218 (-) Transcript_7968:757-1410(-)